MEKLYSSTELCEMLGYKTTWWLVHVLRKAGIKVIKLGPRKVVVQESELKRYIDIQKLKSLTGGKNERKKTKT